MCMTKGEYLPFGTFLHSSVKGDENVRCRECGWEGEAGLTDGISDAVNRLIPGEKVPVGQCPECGGLTDFYEIEEKESVFETKIEHIPTVGHMAFVAGMYDVKLGGYVPTISFQETYALFEWDVDENAFFIAGWDYDPDKLKERALEHHNKVKADFGIGPDS